MSGVVVSHPHAAAVAGALASELASEGLLSAFYTGVAAAPGTVAHAVLQRVGKRHPRVLNRMLAGMDSRSLRAMWAVELAARGCASLTGASAYDLMFTWHDGAVAAARWPRGTRAVYAYEDGALRTFRAAARRGVRRIWDLPLPHWATLDELWHEEASRWPGAMQASRLPEPRWKRVRKDAELELADLVVVASRFTRESLERAGCRKRIVESPYEFPVERFTERTRRPDGPFTVISVGTHDLRKGTPYLLEAWRRLRLPNATLRLVGPLRLSDEFLLPYRGMFEHVPHVPRAELGAEYAKGDLLAFPTLGDGFGLVILEAMCCGTPVLTTRCGGGPECITDGVDGWIVKEREVDAIADVLRLAASQRERAWQMGRAARRTAEKASVGPRRSRAAVAIREFV